MTATAEEDFEAFLERLNATLEPEFGHPEVGLTPCRTAHITGLPRTGTTVLFQLLARTGRVGYPANVMALFWRAPLVGARIQRHLATGRPDIALESEAGRTSEPLAPHEFGYFWRRAMGYSRNSLDQDRTPQPAAELQATLDAVTEVFQAPVVYKNFHALVHAAQLRADMERQAFLMTDRDLLDVGASLLHVRRRLGIPPTEPFGLSPAEPPHNPTEHVRVAHQVRTLADLQQQQAFQNHSDSMVVSYRALCDAPRDTIANVLEFLGVDVQPRDLTDLPQSLRQGSGFAALPDDDQQALHRAMESM